MSAPWSVRLWQLPELTGDEKGLVLALIIRDVPVGDARDRAVPEDPTEALAAVKALLRLCKCKCGVPAVG